jgi:hypothetical protein
MAPPISLHTGSASQDFLAALGRVYGSSGIRRDAFGRRIALPSEVARTLAQDAGDLLPLARLTSQSDYGTFHATISRQDASEV